MSTGQPAAPDRWIKVTPEGLFVAPGNFYVDPVRPVDRAVITHAHADHARPGHRHVLGTAETLAIMGQRMGEGAIGTGQEIAYGQIERIGDVTLWLAPAGHVLGSAQVVLEYGGSRVVVSGDYKRRFDPTCVPFQPVICDVFISEATFGLPVFRHPPDSGEIGRLLHSMALFPERSHAVGCYALGKTQRLIKLLRLAGFDRPIFLHGALLPVCALYERFGVALGDLRPATSASREELRGQLVLAPPSAIADRWAARLTDPVLAVASGWMRVRQRARQRGVELPLVLSDHADWDELVQTIDDVQCAELWVTHGREDALIHHATSRGITARALSLIGFEEDEA